MFACGAVDVFMMKFVGGGVCMHDELGGNGIFCEISVRQT
jgi:hypothetical protein